MIWFGVDFIVPAIHGTVGVLASIKKHGYVHIRHPIKILFKLRLFNSPTVKRVVLTSSVASAAQHQPGAVHTEASTSRRILTPSLMYNVIQASWNDAVIKLVEEQGSKSAEFQLYSASKTHAEKAAWKFMEENKPDFDLVAVLPSFVSTSIIQLSFIIINVIKLS